MGKLGNYDIPQGVTRIGTYAFYACTNLTGVTIPNSITNIIRYGFYGCLGLNTVTIPASVVAIGDYAFSGCDQLTNILFLGDAPSFGLGTFWNDHPGPPKNRILSAREGRLGFNICWLTGHPFGTSN